MRQQERWYHGINRGQWLAMVAAILGWMFDGFEMGLHPLVARPALRDLLRDEIHDDVLAEINTLPDSAVQQQLTPPLSTPGRAMFSEFKVALGKLPPGQKALKEHLGRTLERKISDWNSYLTAVFLFGAAGGGVLFGWLGDRIGRTKAMMWSVLAYSLFTGLGGFAQNPWHLAGCRLLAALGMGGEWALGVALVMEVWPAKARPLMAGFIGAAANFGFLLIAVVSLVLGAALNGEVNWRWLMFIGVLPALLTFLIRLFVPESEKWQKATAEAPKPRVKDMFAPGLARVTLLATLLCGVALLGTWGSVQWIPLWTEQLNEQNPGGPVTFAKEYAQICSAIGACVGTIAAALFAGRYGRRITYVLLCVFSLAATGVLFNFDQIIGAQFLFLVFLAGVTTASFYGWIPLYLPELFPTRIRATGQGLAYNFGRIFAGVGNLVLTGPLAAAIGPGNLAPTLAKVSLIYLLGLVLIWFAPETHGKALPE